MMDQLRVQTHDTGTARCLERDIDWLIRPSYSLLFRVTAVIVAALVGLSL